MGHREGLDEDTANTAVTTAQIDELRLDMQQRIDALTVELQRLNRGDGSPATRSGDDAVSLSSFR